MLKLIGRKNEIKTSTRASQKRPVCSWSKSLDYLPPLSVTILSSPFFQFNFVFLLKLCLIFNFSGLVLFHCWNRLLSKLIFNGFVKFKNQIQSIKVCQGNWLCIVCTAHSSTASNISSIFYPSHLISHLHQYLQQLILVILFAPMYFDARKRLPKSAFCDNIFLQPKIM